MLVCRLYICILPCPNFEAALSVDRNGKQSSMCRRQMLCIVREWHLLICKLNTYTVDKPRLTHSANEKEVDKNKKLNKKMNPPQA
eukprot:scaffold117260_cov20-Prasinocladus_malaysianus.AAC.1